MSDFATVLGAMTSKELAAAHGDHERVAEAIERLTHALAFAVAIGGRGDPEGVNTMLEGIVAHLYEQASSHARLASFLAQVRDDAARKPS